MHELVYSQIHDKEWISNKLLKNIVAGTYKFIEKVAMNTFNRIVLAEDGYINYFKENYKSKLYKIHIIRNFPILKLIPKEKVVKTSDKNIIIYAGD